MPQDFQPSPHPAGIGDLPSQVIHELLQDHHPSWVSLASPYREVPHDAMPDFRHPSLSAWIQLEDT